MKNRPIGYRKALSRIAAAFMLVCFVLTALPMFAAAAEPEFKTFSELSGKTIAAITGSPFEDLIREHIPDVKEVQFYPSSPDMTLALLDGKIDAYFMNNAVGELIANKNEGIEVFPQSLGDSDFGIAFAKNSPERAKWQAAYETIPQDTRQALWKKWTGADDSVKTLPPQDWEGANGTIKAAVCDTLEPMSYVGKDGELIGFDEEMILLIAKQLDVKVEFTGMEFGAMMPEVQSGKALIAAGSIVVTDEREEVVDFLRYAPASYILLVRSAGGTGNSEGFFAGLSASFKRTFITDGRWKMLLSGLGVTLITAVCSGALGTLIGFGLVNLRRKNNIIGNKFIEGYGGLFAGLPVVVVLMVLYYVIFAAANIPAMIVAIIGFALIFGSRSYNVIQNALSAVDSGQREAALALGYTEGKAFREVVLPQAANVYLPLLRAQFIMLLKETSIAGYITVVDLTRAGDLIRSRTMEAFFPLVVVALLYFILTKVMSKLLGLIDKSRDKQRRERRIKGVD